eukprot:5031103-Amphidinium_carterae.1
MQLRPILLVGLAVAILLFPLYLYVGQGATGGGALSVVTEVSYWLPVYTSGAEVPVDASEGLAAEAEWPEWQSILEVPADPALYYGEANLQSSRANDSMCPYLEWAGWHSLQRVKHQEFLPPPVLPSLLRETPLPHAGCPLVYVYRSLPKSWTFLNVSELTRHHVWGRHALELAEWNLSHNEWHPALRDTGQHDGIKALYARLMHTPRCLTDDPDKADLFLIPIFVHEGVHKELSVVKAVSRVCNDNTAEIVKALKHLTWKTAHKHIIGTG